MTITAVILNKIITTPVTLEVRSNKGSCILNVTQARRHIFSVTKMNDLTLNIVTSQSKIIDTLLQILSDDNCTNMFKEIIKCLKTSRVYIFYKIESIIYVSLT